MFCNVYLVYLAYLYRGRHISNSTDHQSRTSGFMSLCLCWDIQQQFKLFEINKPELCRSQCIINHQSYSRQQNTFALYDPRNPDTFALKHTHTHTHYSSTGWLLPVAVGHITVQDHTVYTDKRRHVEFLLPVIIYDYVVGHVFWAASVLNIQINSKTVMTSSKVENVLFRINCVSFRVSSTRPIYRFWAIVNKIKQFISKRWQTKRGHDFLRPIYELREIRAMENAMRRAAK